MQASPETSAPNIAIIGYGLVGDKLAEILHERGFPFQDMRIMASERSAGRTVRLPQREITIEVADQADYSELDIVFNAATAEFSRQHARGISEQGPVFIDSSSAWRQDSRVPLLIPEVNPDVVRAMDLGIVAKPNCTTTIGAMALYPLHQAAGLKGITASSYQSTSGQGQRGINEHQSQIRRMVARSDDLLHGRLGGPYPTPEVFPTITAFNVAPMAGTFEDDSDLTTEELKFKNEMRKILGLDEETLPVDVTCARVSVVNAHSLSIQAEFENEISAAEAHEILADAPGVELHIGDDIPQAITAAGTDPVHVGRVRQSERFGLHGLNFWVVGDNIRKGAALNLVQGAELLLSRGL